MKVFLTGGSGFIGSHVLLALLRTGHSVTVLARNPTKADIFSKLSRLNFVYGKISDTELIHSTLKGMDACIHIALGWGTTPSKMLLADTLPAVSLFENCAEQGVEHLISTSSTAAIGEYSNDHDESSPCRPKDNYGATKAAGEAFLLALAANSDLRANIIRPGYTFGNPVIPGADTQPDTRFRDIAKKARLGEDIVLIKNDGTQFMDASDLAQIYLAILNADCNREVFFGLGSTWHSWEEIALRSIRICNSSSQIILQDRGWSTPPHLFDVKKIDQFFGLSFDADKKLTRHIEWCLTQACT